MSEKKKYFLAKLKETKTSHFISGLSIICILTLLNVIHTTEHFAANLVFRSKKDKLHFFFHEKFYK